MKNENGAALLAQDDSKAKNHTCILQAFDAAVKAHDLKNALGLLEMKPQDTVALMQGMFPSFDKTVLSKCSKPEKYGCVLHPAGYGNSVHGLQNLRFLPPPHSAGPDHPDNKASPPQRLYPLSGKIPPFPGSRRD